MERQGPRRHAPPHGAVVFDRRRRVGRAYVYDRANARIVAVSKIDGAYVAQYRLAGGVEGWDDVRGMYVTLGIDEIPATLVWIGADGVHEAVLDAVPDVPPPSPTAAPTDTPAPSASPKATPKSTKKP